MSQIKSKKQRKIEIMRKNLLKHPGKMEKKTETSVNEAASSAAQIALDEENAGDLMTLMDQYHNGEIDQTTYEAKKRQLLGLS
jgi:hypothetical protein